MSKLDSHPTGIGSTPALVVVDMCRGFIDARSPLGFECSDLIESNISLVDQFRVRKLPVIFTTTIYRNDSDASVFRSKIPALNILKPNSEEVSFLDELAPSEGETVIEKKIIKVNSPMTIGSTRIYLQANGYSPVVTVKDSKGNVAFQGPVPFLPQDANLRSIGAIKVPDAEPQIGFVGSFVPTYVRDANGGGALSAFPKALDPRLLLAAWAGDLGLDSGVPQSVYRIDTSKMLQVGLKSLKPGEVFEYPGGSITFEGYIQWVNLNFVADPGKKFALLGGIVAILGLLASLFTRRRRIWIRVGSQVEVAGLAKNGAPGLDVEMEQFVRMLKGDK